MLLNELMKTCSIALWTYRPLDTASYMPSRHKLHRRSSWPAEHDRTRAHFDKSGCKGLAEVSGVSHSSDQADEAP